MNLELVRHAYLPDCTLGWLSVAGERFATLSQPWVKNPEGPGGMPARSCVPDGQYKLTPHDSQKHPGTYQLVNIGVGVFVDALPDSANAGQYGRTTILLHPGNTTADTEGCILIATSFGMMNGHHAVVDSVKAFEKLRSILGRESHVLLIRTTRGTDEP